MQTSHKKNGKYSRDPLQKDVLFFWDLKKQLEEVKEKGHHHRTEENLRVEEKGFSRYENYLFLRELIKNIGKRGKVELKYVNGEKVRGRTWSIDGRLIHEQRWKDGKVTRATEFLGNELTKTTKGNNLVFRLRGRVFLKEIRDGEIRKFAKYDKDGNIKKVFCRKNGKPFECEVKPKEFGYF
nr:hypothetical protein [Marseillevirus cajuinensis]